MIRSSIKKADAAGDVIVLCYHAVSEDWASDLSVTPTTLQRQVEHLLNRGYKATTLSEALAAPAGVDRVAVTFDDGYRSVVTHALPVLSSLGVPATAFVCTSFIGMEKPMIWRGIEEWHDGKHDAELLSLSWDEARSLADAGWEIGSHSCTHPHLTELADEDLDRELVLSREACEREIGRPCSSLAYPHSDVDGRVVARARAAGYEWACTLPRRFVRPSPLTWPRIGLYERDGMHTLWLKVSPRIRRVRASAVGPLAEDVHRFVRSLRSSS